MMQPQFNLTRIADDAGVLVHVSSLIELGLVDVLAPEPTPAQLRSTIEYLAKNLSDTAATLQQLANFYGRGDVA